MPCTWRVAFIPSRFPKAFSHLAYVTLNVRVGANSPSRCPPCLRNEDRAHASCHRNAIVCPIISGTTRSPDMSLSTAFYRLGVASTLSLVQLNERPFFVDLSFPFLSPAHNHPVTHIVVESCVQSWLPTGLGFMPLGFRPHHHMGGHEGLMLQRTVGRLPSTCCSRLPAYIPMITLPPADGGHADVRICGFRRRHLTNVYLSSRPTIAQKTRTPDYLGPPCRAAFDIVHQAPTRNLANGRALPDSQFGIRPDITL